MLDVCPICGSHAFGKIGYRRWFCADCCHEISVSKSKNVVYYPGEDGEMRIVGKIDDARDSFSQARKPNEAIG
jgi:ribosomal protein L37AE/L43A